MKKKILIGVGVVAGLILIAGIGGCSMIVGQRNAMVTADEQIDAAWAQVDNVLQRRADLVPNLVNTVKGIAKQERDVFVGVAEARSRVAGAGTRAQKIEANQQLGSALSRLLLVVERYPDLKSNQNFLALQTQLEGTENRIAVERRRYNQAIQTYNTMIRRFPGNIVAGLFGFEKRDEYFEATPESREVPEVEFN